MDKLTYSFKDGVAVITLDDGKANALGAQSWAELNEALDMAEAEDAIVVITGREGVMSGGFDLKDCLLYTSPSPRDQRGSRMPSSA